MTAPAPINFTDNAASKVYELICEEENSDLHLRVFITGGGCSGFQYGFTFEEAVNDDDVVINKTVLVEQAETGSEVSLLVDPISLQYLMGAEIDYKEDLSGSQFVIRNPNASTTCGCGSSFST